MARIRMIDRDAADGELLEVYTALAARPLPPVYRPPHGGPPGIIRAHSLDPALMRAVFGATGSTHQGEALAWAERELVAAVSSRINQCVY
jgi:alkylhydroperoxidase family enzyme